MTTDRRRSLFRRRRIWRDTPGSQAGIENQPERHDPPPPESISIRCIDYGPSRIADTEVDDLAAFLAQPAPEWSQVRWLNIEGLHPYIVDQLRLAYDLHTLASEDVLHVPQRPKVDVYDEQSFIVADMLRLSGGHLESEQVSFFLLPQVLISFQEQAGDVWDPIRARLEREGSMLRKLGADYLLYTLLDAIVDHIFPVMETFGDRLELLETRILEDPTPELLADVHAVKRELLVVRRAMWPTRQLVDDLLRSEDQKLSATTRMYLRDVYQHVVQIIDMVELYREMSQSATDLHISVLSNRMNEIMKVLTMIATLFIPITFLAGVYGMNFEFLPELHWRYAYPAFWILCLVILVGLVLFFRRKGWLDG